MLIALQLYQFQRSKLLLSGHSLCGDAKKGFYTSPVSSIGPARLDSRLEGWKLELEKLVSLNSRA